MDAEDYGVGVNPHHDLVEMLRAQDEEPPYTIFDPVILTKKEEIHFGAYCRIDSFCKLEGGEGLWIGAYVHIASFAHINIGGGETLLENFSAVASGARIISGSNQHDALSMSAAAPAEQQRIVKKQTRIGKYACVLVNAVVLPGIRLHDGAVLAAGAVATRDIPAWEIWAGTPAKFMAKRTVTR